MRKRPHRVEVYLSDKEYDLLAKDVERSGLSREAYMRSLIQKNRPKELPPMDFFDILRELRQLNVNMNQIALKAHSLNLIDAPYYEKCHKDLQSIVGEIKREIFK